MNDIMRRHKRLRDKGNSNDNDLTLMFMFNLSKCTHFDYLIQVQIQYVS